MEMPKQASDETDDPFCNQRNVSRKFSKDLLRTQAFAQNACASTHAPRVLSAGIRHAVDRRPSVGKIAEAGNLLEYST
jgi:hypothetical protein